MNELRTMAITYTFANTLQAAPTKTWGPFHTMKFKWSCAAEYDFADDSETTYTVRISSTIPSGAVNRLYCINISLIVLCLISIALCLKSLYKSYQVYCYARRRLEIEPTEGDTTGLQWSGVTFRDKLAFFNLWDAWLIAGHMALIVAAVVSAIPGTEELDRAHRDINSEQLSRSAGTFFVMFSLIKYMESYLEFYMLVIAVRSSAIRVMKFTVMIL